MSRLLALSLSILLSGCIKCPDSLSVSPNVYKDPANQYYMDGFHFSADWYLPVDNNTFCSKIEYLYRRFK